MTNANTIKLPSGMDARLMPWLDRLPTGRVFSTKECRLTFWNVSKHYADDLLGNLEARGFIERVSWGKYRRSE